jgi:predicted class III extradiol MEMO1 family dioxygenase
MKTGMFERLSLDEDEEEHSIEMQYPFLAHMMAEYATLLKSFIIELMLACTSTVDEGD